MPNVMLRNLLMLCWELGAFPQQASHNTCSPRMLPLNFQGVLRIPGNSSLPLPGQKPSKETKTLLPPLVMQRTFPGGPSGEHALCSSACLHRHHPERGCHHGSVPPPLPNPDSSCKLWKRSRVAERALSNPGLTSKPAGWWNPLQWPRRSAGKRVIPWMAKCARNRYITSLPHRAWFLLNQVCHLGVFLNNLPAEKRGCLSGSPS